jgi:holo-[acyl-carrier protein] synthase
MTNRCDGRRPFAAAQTDFSQKNRGPAGLLDLSARSLYPACIRKKQGCLDMILGIGSDLANIERIEGTIARFGARFLTRVFTAQEQAKADSRPHTIAATYAKRWAAKEACSKALGTGLRMGIAWRDMAVSNLWTGQPVMHLSGWAAQRLAEMTPPDHRAVVHVTLTDDHPWAQAFVVIEALPLSPPLRAQVTDQNPPSS